MDCNLPGSSVHGILQAIILEWVAIPSSRTSSQSRDQTWVSHTAGRFFTVELPGKPSLRAGKGSKNTLMSPETPSSLWTRSEKQSGL